MHTHTTQTKQVGIFPCRGWVAPCQRAPGSIKGLRFDVKRGKGGGSVTIRNERSPSAEQSVGRNQIATDGMDSSRSPGRMAGDEGTRVGRSQEGQTMDVTTVAVDLAKEVFQIALANRAGRVIDRRRLTRRQFERLIDDLPSRRKW